MANNPIEPAQLLQLVDAELSAVADERVIAQIRSLLVTPLPELRLWDYGEPGQRYECWTVVADTESKTSIAYCRDGFGSKCPWGLLWNECDLDDPRSSMGMDGSWYTSFLDAYFESRASERLPIWRVFEQIGHEWPGRTISQEGTYDEAWAQIADLRAANPDRRYCPWHTTRREHS